MAIDRFETASRTRDRGGVSGERRSVRDRYPRRARDVVYDSLGAGDGMFARSMPPRADERSSSSVSVVSSAVLASEVSLSRRRAIRIQPAGPFLRAKERNRALITCSASPVATRRSNSTDDPNSGWRYRSFLGCRSTSRDQVVVLDSTQLGTCRSVSYRWTTERLLSMWRVRVCSLDRAHRLI